MTFKLIGEQTYCHSTTLVTNKFLIPRGAVKEIPTVVTEHKRPDGSHIEKTKNTFEPSNENFQ